MSIQRLDPDTNMSGLPLMVRAYNGGYVDYNDHVAEVVRLKARERELTAALREIRGQEWTENVLDPQWAARIAHAALAAVSAETEDDT